MAKIERSTEDIRQDIAKEEENLSHTFEEIGERIKEKMDWKAYTREYPYLILGAAAGFGYFASTLFKKRTTPMERIMNTISREVRHSFGKMNTKHANPGLIKAALLGIATKAATGFVKNTSSEAWTNGGSISRNKKK